MPGWPTDVNVLVAACVAIVGALCGIAVQVSRTFVQVRENMWALHRAGVGVAGTHMSPPAPNPGSTGGGASPALRLLQDPGDNQLTDLTVSTVAAATGAVDCGPECVVWTIQYVRGVETIAQLLRLRWFGAINDRLTSGDDLVGMLAHNHIPSHLRQVSATVMHDEATRAATDGKPCIILGHWLSPNIGHWWVFRGSDTTGVHVMDPWGGVNKTVPWAELESAYMGQYVHVDEVIAF